MIIERTHRYDDIIDMPHHVSRTRAPMPNSERAAQFMPFAALTGYDAAIMQAAHAMQLQTRIHLTDESKADINKRLQQILDHASASTLVTITYFQPTQSSQTATSTTISPATQASASAQQPYSDGVPSAAELGAYSTLTSSIRRYDDATQTLHLTSGEVIALTDIADISASVNS